MAGSVNKVILIGNLGADPEIRRTQDGRPVANLRLATSESWKDKTTGERKEKTEWHRVVIFNENLCRIAEQYLAENRCWHICDERAAGGAGKVGSECRSLRQCAGDQYPLMTSGFYLRKVLPKDNTTPFSVRRCGEWRVPVFRGPLASGERTK